MLILKRKIGESISIGGNITVTILDIDSDKIKIAIEAPKEIPVVRSELIIAADTNREAVAAPNTQAISTLKDMIHHKKNS